MEDDDRLGAILLEKKPGAEVWLVWRSPVAPQGASQMIGTRFQPHVAAKSQVTHSDAGALPGFFLLVDSSNSSRNFLGRI